MLEGPSSLLRRCFDGFMILLVISSIGVLIWEVRHDLGRWGDLFEVFALSFFLSEYLLRVWIHNDMHRILLDHFERSRYVGYPFRMLPAVREIIATKWQYVTTPLAIIDLLAIVPSYRPLRFLRLFLIFRLFKLMRYSRTITYFVSILSEKRDELQTLGLFMGLALIAAASAIYFFEVDRPGSEIHTFFDGIYWALVTISTVGYGDITPTSPEGRVIALILIMFGIGVISFFTSIIVSAFSDKLGTNRVYTELNRKAQHTIVCGHGRVGQVLCRKLAADKIRFVVVDTDPSKTLVARKAGFLAIEADATDDSVLTELGLGRNAIRILCLTGEDVANLYITLSARQADPEIEIISRVDKQENREKMSIAGANYCVTPHEAVSMMVSELMGQPVAFEALRGIFAGNEGIHIEAMSVFDGSPMQGKTIKELDMNRHKLLLFGVVTPTADDELSGQYRYDLGERSLYFRPPEEFVLKDRDVLVFFGHHYSVQHFKDRLEYT